MNPNIERLENLVRVLRKPIPKGMKFSLRNWDDGVDVCACGLAAKDKWFRIRGIVPVADYSGCGQWRWIEKFFDLTRKLNFFFIGVVMLAEINEM
jgi:hypothetical protein